MKIFTAEFAGFAERNLSSAFSAVNSFGGKMKKYLLVGILLLAFGYPLFAISPNAGRAVVTPFEIGITARQSGVGEAFTGYYDCNSILYNPASLAMLDQEYFTVTHEKWIVGSSQSYFSMGLPFNWGYLAGGIVYFNQGEIDVSHNWVYQNERKSVSDLGVVLGYGGNFHKYLALGANVKFLYFNWADYSATGFAADFGAFMPSYTLPYGIGDLHAGLVVQNIGTPVRVLQVAYNQPLTPKLGFAINFPKVSVFDFIFLGDASYPIYDGGFRANLGLEVGIYNYFALRGGYRIGYDVSQSAMTLGAGLKYKSFHFDYAMINYDYAGLTHRFTLCIGLSEMKPVGPFRAIDRKLDDMNATINGKLDNLQADVTDLKMSVEEVKGLIKTSLKTAIDMFYIRHLLNVLFPFDSYKIPSTEYWKIDEAVRLINVYYADQQIVLQGHTDVAGTVQYNQPLSEHRAQAVKEYMVAKGISADKIVITGFGKTQPLNQEHGPGKTGMENRRVIFIVSEE
jgi:outer membrane protein OmpA-like peptidoglycan-associated protein